MKVTYTRETRAARRDKWLEMERKTYEAHEFNSLVERAEGWLKLDKNMFGMNTRVHRQPGMWQETATNPRNGAGHRFTIKLTNN
ncbi:hypothetical protein [Lacticaseibacillus rhamnosus]|uniref:hypothetical protein n=1 Tax=Lacticaseibacillus rhamnosus TaxID=47715 RepID=UPI00237F3CFC|nr:hypothetical protein [Lacticaseibacillus rhamnosus]MDE3295898.1 hypothetical protein [Lacticaseibacillus rhamnosus]